MIYCRNERTGKTLMGGEVSILMGTMMPLLGVDREGFLSRTVKYYSWLGFS